MVITTESDNPYDDSDSSDQQSYRKDTARDM